jgi:hypothetical protein
MTYQTSVEKIILSKLEINLIINYKLMWIFINTAKFKMTKIKAKEFFTKIQVRLS